MSQDLAQFPGFLLGHLELSLVALLVGAALSIPAGILVTRWQRFEGPLLGVASVIQTIPSLALLAMMVQPLQKMARRRRPIFLIENLTDIDLTRRVRLRCF